MNIGVKDAAVLMGKTEEFVRVGLQIGALPFGRAVLTPSGRYSYYIDSLLFEKYMGIKLNSKKKVVQKRKVKKDSFYKFLTDDFVDLRNKLISNLLENVSELNNFQEEVELLKLMFLYEMDNKKKQEIKCHN